LTKIETYLKKNNIRIKITKLKKIEKKILTYFKHIDYIFIRYYIFVYILLNLLLLFIYV